MVRAPCLTCCFELLSGHAGSESNLVPASLAILAFLEAIIKHNDFGERGMLRARCRSGGSRTVGLCNR